MDICDPDDKTAYVFPSEQSDFDFLGFLGYFSSTKYSFWLKTLTKNSLDSLFLKLSNLTQLGRPN